MSPKARPRNLKSPTIVYFTENISSYDWIVSQKADSYYFSIHEACNLSALRSWTGSKIGRVVKQLDFARV